MVTPARRDRGLLRHQGREVLIADLRRRQEEGEEAKTEGSNFRPPRPATRRNHTQLTHATLTLLTHESDGETDLLKIDSSVTADD